MTKTQELIAQLNAEDAGVILINWRDAFDAYTAFKNGNDARANMLGLAPDADVKLNAELYKARIFLVQGNDILAETERGNIIAFTFSRLERIN